MIQVFLGMDWHRVVASGRVVFILALFASSCGGKGPDDAELAAGHSAQATPQIVNSLAGAVRGLFQADQRFSPQVVGHGLPPDVTPWHVFEGEIVRFDYKKELESVLGFSLVEVTYSLSYMTKATHDGRGRYLANVTVTPTRVSTDPFWSIQGAAVSEQASNVGTRVSPVASLRVLVQLTVGSLCCGRVSVTDEFRIRGDKDEPEAILRDFDRGSYNRDESDESGERWELTEELPLPTE